MTEREVRFQRVTDDGTLRQARVAERDVVKIIHELEEVPGGVAESPFAADAAAGLTTAMGKPDGEASGHVIPDGQSDAIHWALERMMADNQRLSAGLDDLRDVVEP
jgi:hypothetical protein